MSLNAALKQYKKQMNLNKKRDINEEIILELVPIIKRISIRIKNRIYSNLTVDEIFSIAIVAVVEAISKIENSNKEELKHYLLKRARGAIYDELRKTDSLTRTARDFITKFNKIQEKLFETLGREPTLKEMANEMNMSEEELDEELKKTQTVDFFSIESWYQREDGSNSFDEIVAGNSPDGYEKIDEVDIQSKMLQSLDKLNFQERLILSFYYYDELNFKEISLILGITPGRISQIHSKALIKLKNLMQNTKTTEKK